MIPNWPSQSWWPSLTNLASRNVNLERNVDVLRTEGRMRKVKKYLSPGEILIFRLEAIQEKSSSNGSYQRNSLMKKQHNKLLRDDIVSGADIYKE